MVDISNIVVNCPRCITGLYLPEGWERRATPEQREYISQLHEQRREQWKTGGTLSSEECPTYPALSRFDNKTWVCDRCGQEEGIQNLLKPGTPLSKPALPDLLSVVDGNLRGASPEPRNPLPKGWIYRTGKNGVILVSHPLNADTILTVMNPHHPEDKSLAQQVAEDTCKPHREFLCPICYNYESH